jgi:hypothetical protein
VGLVGAERGAEAHARHTDVMMDSSVRGDGAAYGVCFVIMMAVAVVALEGHGKRRGGLGILYM